MPNKFELESHTKEDSFTEFIHKLDGKDSAKIASSDGNRMVRWVGTNIFSFSFSDGESGEEKPWYAVSDEVLLNELRETKATGGLWIRYNGTVKQFAIEKGKITDHSEANNGYHNDQLALIEL